MKRLPFIGFLLALLHLSCAKEYDHLLSEEVDDDIITSDNPYKISQREALLELQNFLSSSNITKSDDGLSNKKISNVRSVATSVNTKKRLTKSKF